MAENRPYLVIARKYRPKQFDELIGQEAVTATLKNALTLGRVGHAYLFSGPRGVGKTSMARIFAKALNCKNGPTAKPCGSCPACAEIDASRSLDVQEIDGASNRGIDEIRALRENVKFSPASGRYKIYVIDEVHQITPDAFNALLKTLEEPPAHVKFIFATTSPQRVPVTILSRCQRLEFRRLSTAAIASALKDICKKEKIKIDEEALHLVAKAADGSLRDGQSLLDQLSSSGPGPVTRERVIASLGALEEERILKLTGHLASKQASEALLCFDEAMREGKDPALFLERFLEHVRDLLFVKTSEKLIELIDATESHREALKIQASQFSKEELFYFFAVIAQTRELLKRFERKRVPVEIALVKLAERAPMQALEKLVEALGSDPARAELKPSALPELPRRRPRTQASDDQRDDPPEAYAAVPEAVIGTKRSVPLEAVWPGLLEAVKVEKISVASYLAEGEPSELSNGVARVAFPEKHSFHRESLESPDNRKLIEKHLSALLKQPVRVEFFSVKGAEEPSSAAGGSGAPPSPEAENALKSAMNLFGGRVIQG